MRTVAARLALLVFMTLLVGCDHVTKVVAKAELEGEKPREVIHGVLDLQYAENRDVAFNLLRWVPEGTRTPVLIVAGGLALLLLVTVLLRRRPQIRLARAAVLLVTAGALGNYL